MGELGFLIPIMGIIMGVSIPITAIKLRHREKIEQMRLAAAGNRDSGSTERQDARIEVLEDRVRVLERIVTDGGYDLAQKIEALRARRTARGSGTAREGLMGELIGLAAVIGVFGIPIVAIWTQHQRKVLEMQAKLTAEKAAQYAAGNSELEERVRVLERIVTDRGYDVATQIEALRDQRRVEERLETRAIEEKI